MLSVRTLVNSKLSQKLKKEDDAPYPALNMTSTRNGTPAKFPTLNVDSLGELSTADDLAHKSQNAIISTIELKAYSNKTLTEARNIMDKAGDVMISMGYTLIYGPEDISDTNHVMVARFRRTWGADLKLVDRSGANAFYCISNKGNEVLIEEIEKVLQDIMFDDPKFEGLLNEKYFGHNSVSSAPLYTKEELEYIANVGTVKVKLIQDQTPTCYVENGQTKGIWVEVLKLLSEKSGIQFELESAGSEEYSVENLDKILQDGYLLLRTQRAMEHTEGETETVSSNAITSVSLSYVKRQSSVVEEESGEQIIAMSKDLSYLQPIILEENKGYKVCYYSNVKECLEALLREEVDLVIQNTHRVSYLMQKPEYAEKLMEVSGVNHSNAICIVAPADQEMLINIINRAIHHISNDEINSIIKKELLMNPYPLALEDIVYLYWEWMIVILLGIIAAIVVYTVVTRKMADMRIQKKEYELLQKKIQLDELTGLYNRTFFYEKAKDQIENTNEDMCIVTMDISNFKVVNELYGINAGDELLKDVAGQIQALDARHDMVLARFMADHYYLCMPKAEFDEIVLPNHFDTFLEDMDIRVVCGKFISFGLYL